GGLFLGLRFPLGLLFGARLGLVLRGTVRRTFPLGPDRNQDVRRPSPGFVGLPVVLDLLVVRLDLLLGDFELAELRQDGALAQLRGVHLAQAGIGLAAPLEVLLPIADATFLLRFAFGELVGI